MPWVFTYSDLSPQLLETILERAPFCSLPASLPNYKISFRGRSRKWGGALATLDKGRKSWVYGSALLLPPEDIRLIDKYHHGYETKEVTVFLDATKDKIKAKTYMLKSSIPFGQPSEEYIKAILKHLKFFWGQTGSGKISLENFGITIATTDEPEKAKFSKKRTKDPSPEIEPEDSPAEVEQDAVEKVEKPKKRKRRRTVKKK